MAEILKQVNASATITLRIEGQEDQVYELTGVQSWQTERDVVEVLPGHPEYDDRQGGWRQTWPGPVTVQIRANEIAVTPQPQSFDKFKIGEG